ncbi:heme A synthase [Microbacterium sp. ZXX196]|uniref:COX15/CtaA family protein n=1 Tax=Microbacterium sp. ZXX196 TaxID=2609291 RepID=UPI0012B6BC17|nr:COX15/CtaA family protein [Microbacterium sp. ZXX196]MTE23613.1 heme A synthase [Microbacterium sp. ZXX196]
MTAVTSAPTRFSTALYVFAWLSFLAEVIIIATGGTVRLTGSGLGCTEWPLCTPDSLVPTEAMGVHGVIEFSNRLMSTVVGVLALVVLVLVWRRRAERRDLFVLAWIVLGGVLAQAVAGGVTVWTGLNAFLVAFHYTASLVLVCVAAAFLVRLYEPAGPRERAVPRGYAALVHATSLVLAVTIAFGVLTTSNGPHSGDADVVRNGFDATILAHVHAWPGYILLALTLAIAGIAWARRLPTRRWSLAFLGALAVQIFVGVWQANTALPPLLVGIHMVLAALTSAAYVVVVLRLKRPARA